eukprot:3084906-Rhodomonas_salina.1
MTRSLRSEPLSLRLQTLFAWSSASSLCLLAAGAEREAWPGRCAGAACSAAPLVGCCPQCVPACAHAATASAPDAPDTRPRRRGHECGGEASAGADGGADGGWRGGVGHADAGGEGLRAHRCCRVHVRAGGELHVQEQGEAGVGEGWRRLTHASQRLTAAHSGSEGMWGQRRAVAKRAAASRPPDLQTHCLRRAPPAAARALPGSLPPRQTLLR